MPHACMDYYFRVHSPCPLTDPPSGLSWHLLLLGRLEEHEETRRKLHHRARAVS